ncbi:restriction endonuclease subunit S [Holophaga foetida]|uniref:restriction endonuclease subunit S n=1 Tax=Holophaga foetida TaxID=35839 RepID=UPI0002474666|nr:restriction endonuclease subunit S [Holophaga foetida]
MKHGWKVFPFTEAIEDVSAGNLKTPQSEFLVSGQFPVVDQGKALVAGYGNDPTRLCKTHLPAIVFGDHTRCFKFIDFPFCIGADGVKVLRPKVEADEKYLFHFLCNVELIDAGYDRHFKHLKRIDVVIPPLPEQRRIAAILDQAEALRAKRRAALAKLDTLAQSIFIEMFGDPALNLRKWPISTIAEVAEQVTDGEHLTPLRSSEGIKLLSARNIRDGFIDFGNVDYIPQSEHERIKRRCNPSRGDVLISCSGSIGRVASVEVDEPFSLVRSAALVRPRSSVIHNKFLEHYLRTPALRARMEKRANASSQANLFQGQIRELPVLVPPMAEQRRFVALMMAVDQLAIPYHTSALHLDSLFASLQHRAFRGEL